MDTHLLHNPVVRSVLTVVVAVALQMVAARVIEHLVRRLVLRHRFEHKVDEKKREDTIIHILRTLANVAIWILAALVILATLGVNLAALATGAGLLGVVVGLGAQNTIKDFLAGMFILIENQYRVGDIVMLSGGSTGGGTAGVVEDITLRITKLRAMDGTLNVVRNGEASIIANMTYQYSSVVVDVVVSYDSDVDTVEKVMNEVGVQVAGDDRFKGVTTEAIQFLRIDSFTPDGVTARAVGKVAPAAQWEVAGAYRRQLLAAFHKHGLKMALPQRVVHTAKTKE
jgi:small conductance mechanosensitive channel